MELSQSLEMQECYILLRELEMGSKKQIENVDHGKSYGEIAIR